jgi:hypothetical protein
MLNEIDQLVKRAPDEAGEENRYQAVPSASRSLRHRRCSYIEPGPYRTEIWNSTKWIVPANSAYLSWLKLLRQAADRHQAKTSRDPQEVALVVAKALEAKRPRFRYQVGFFAKLDYFLRRKMPTKLIRRDTTRYLGLPVARW